MKKDRPITQAKEQEVDFVHNGKSKMDKSKLTSERQTRKSRRKKQSDQQYAIPQNIPLSESEQLFLFQSFDRNLTTCIIQVPFPLNKMEKFQKVVVSRVESTIIQILVSKNSVDNVAVSLKIKNISNGHQNNSVIVQNKTAIDQNNSVAAQNNSVVVIKDSLSQADCLQIVYEIWGKLCWFGAHQTQSKMIKKSRKIINEADFTQIAKVTTKQANSDLFLVLNIESQEQTSEEYRGLINQGNTCYMNSYLQMLYHIVEFRNLVFEAQTEDQNKFPATLQTLFYKLENDERAVSPQQLVRSFGWTKKQVQVQQDAQQFSCIFFEKLEQKLSESIDNSNRMSMSQLFQGQLIHYIKCQNVGKI